LVSASTLSSSVSLVSFYKGRAVNIPSSTGSMTSILSTRTSYAHTAEKVIIIRTTKDSIQSTPGPTNPSNYSVNGSMQAYYGGLSLICVDSPNVGFLQIPEQLFKLPSSSSKSAATSSNTLGLNSLPYFCSRTLSFSYYL